MVTYDSPNIDRRIYLAADALQEAGYEVDILTPFANPEAGFEHINIINLIEKNNINTVTSPIFLKDKLKKILPGFMFDIIKNLYSSLFMKDGHLHHLDSMISKAADIKADYYVANDLPTLPIVKACIDKNGGTFIYDAHEFFLGQDVFSSSQKKNLEKIETAIFPYVDFFITVNDDIRKLFFDKYGEKKSEIIYNATKCTLSEKKYLHDLIGIEREEKIILYQGGFIENRKLENLIHISQYLKHCKLVMLGWGISENKLKSLAQKLDVLDKKVFFVPKISQKELIPYTSSATLGIIPYDGYDLNTTYCTPNKLFEFICAELPIIYNDNLFTVNSIVNENNFGLPIDIVNYRETANKIDELIENPEALACFKENLQQNKHDFSWESEKNKLINIFKKLD